MNPYSDIDRQRLFKASETAFRILFPFRVFNRTLVEDYVGSAYGYVGRVRHDDMLNLLNQAVDAYTMCLVANRPRVLVSTQNQILDSFASQYQLALNNYIQEIGLEYTLRKWVLDAFFCIGIIKVHMADSAEVEFEKDIWINPGQPYASNVSLDNFVYDLGATTWKEIKYAGDMYRIPFSDLESDMFDQNVARTLQPTSKYGVQDDRLSRITKGWEVDHDEFEPMIDLADIWVPRDRKIYTFAIDTVAQFRMKGDPLAVLDWNGPDHGPYHILGFNDVPENIMPTSPASHLANLNRLVNNLMRKQSRRARGQKINHTYTAAGAQSAKNIQRASDDEWIMVNDPAEIGTVPTGGVDPNTQSFMLGTMELFDRMAGNLTAMLGLGAQASTVGQEQIIGASVSKKEASMQYRVVDGTIKIIESLGCMLWHDKFKTIQGQVPVEGATEYSIPMDWTPDDREGDISDYNFGIDLFSMPFQSPAQRVQAINQLMTQIYAPLSQMLMQQGGTINMEQLTELYAELLNLPQLRKIYQFTAPTQPAASPGGDGGGDQPGMPAATHREYVRRNVPTGGTAQSRSHVMQQSWMGAGNNQAQAASMAHAPA